MKQNSISETQNLFPFLTGIRIGSDEYVGIVINTDNQIISIYDIGALKFEADKQKILDLGEIWWWESNRKIPINIFLKSEMIAFRNIIKTFNNKDVTILFGPTINLSEISEKRVKRKSIQLVRKNI